MIVRRHDREPERHETPDVLARVAHDARSPLADIVLAAEHMLEGHPGPLTPTQQRLLEMIAHSANRGLTLVRELAESRRPAAEGERPLEICPEWYDLGRLVSLHGECVRPRAELQGIRPSVDAEPGTWTWCDPSRIEQVIDNLLTNALKFTPPGGHVTVGVHTGTDGCVLLSVSDDGIGIPQAEQHLPGRQGYRSNLALSKGIPGTGLGFAIAEALVRAHDGQISIDSDEGRGTTVYVSLPASQPRMRSRAATAPNTDAGGSTITHAHFGSSRSVAS